VPAVYPLFHPIMALAAANGAPVFSVKSSDPKRVLGLAHERSEQKRILWLANLTAEPQAVHIQGALPGSTTVRQLDTVRASAAALDPAGFAAAGRPMPGSSLTLGPYAVAALDGAF
jgi:D-apionolactonase